MPARNLPRRPSTAHWPHAADSPRGPARRDDTPERDPLRILVISTPKTGNTWLKLILAEIYGLPVVDLPEDPAAIDPAALPESWVAQQHYWFSRETRDRLERAGITVLTTVRHPADVFVSLWHHVRKQGGAPVADARHSGSLRLDGDRMGVAARDFAGQGFYRDLHVSVSWLRSGQSLAVRYEDLWAQPMATLKQVTGFIRTCDELALRRAISLCQIARLQRAKVDSGSGFFRRGGIGGWVEALPTEIKQLLTSAPPYPEQFAFLGYSMNPDQYPADGAVPADYSADPFGGKLRFDNGVPICPVLIRCYFDALAADRHEWPDPLASGRGCFFDWLVSPAKSDPACGATPVVTELAAYLHRQRTDVQAAFPEPFGRDRLAFTNWFTTNATDEYQLDHHLVMPVFRSWAERAPLPVAGGA